MKPEDTNQLRKLLTGIESACYAPGMGSLRYMLDQIDTLWQLCPFAVGDRVCLSETPQISVASGWWGSRHFLVKGAVATVVDRQFYDGHFTVGLIFDDESWVDDHGKQQPTSTEYEYWFDTKKLEPAREVTWG